MLSELFARISVVTIGLTLVKLITKKLMARDFLNYQLVQSLTLRRKGIRSISSVPQNPESGNCKSGDLSAVNYAHLEIS